MSAKIQIVFLLLFLCGLPGCGMGEGGKTEYVLGESEGEVLSFPGDALEISDLSVPL